MKVRVVHHYHHPCHHLCYFCAFFIWKTSLQNAVTVTISLLAKWVCVQRFSLVAHSSSCCCSTSFLSSFVHNIAIEIDLSFNFFWNLHVLPIWKIYFKKSAKTMLWANNYLNDLLQSSRNQCHLKIPRGIKVC